MPQSADEASDAKVAWIKQEVEAISVSSVHLPGSAGMSNAVAKQSDKLRQTAKFQSADKACKRKNCPEEIELEEILT